MPVVADLIDFYTQYLTYYRKWATLHRYGYWVLVWLSLICGIAVAYSLLFKLEMIYVAALALGLNCLLIVSNAIGSDKKYARYRVAEIRLTFEFQYMRQNVARKVLEGASEDIALANALEDLHQKVQALVLGEFSDFFREMNTIEEIHSQLSQRTKPKGHH